MGTVRCGHEGPTRSGLTVESSEQAASSEQTANQRTRYSRFRGRSEHVIQILQLNGKLLSLHRESRTRPAPSELPQGRNAARVGGRSGAMY